MDSQLDWVTSLFDEHDIDWWVESGTLLTLTRSGELTAYDDDIDLAMWADDLESLEAVLPAFEDRGYGVQSRSYAGRVYKYQFVPEEGEDHLSSSKRRLIDLMVFRRRGSHAWTAQSRLKEDPTGVVEGALVALVRPFVERYARGASGHNEMTSFPKSHLLETFTLWLPLEFVEEIEYDDDLGVYAPADREGYLAFRYGDWRTPVEEWSLTDDRAIVERPPDEVLADRIDTEE